MSDAQRRTQAPSFASGRPGGMHGPGSLGMPGEKPKDARGTLRRLGPYLSLARWGLIAAFIATAASTLLSVAGPKYLGEATTLLFNGVVARGASGVDFAALERLLGLLCVLYGLSAVFGYAQQWLMAGIAQKVVSALRADVRGKLSRLPLSYFDAKSHGDIMSRASNDIDTVSTTLQQSLSQLLGALMTVAGTLAMMLTISPLLTLIAVGTLPLAALATAQVAKRSKAHFKEQQKTLGELTGHVEEAFSGHLAVKAFGQEGRSVEAFDGINERLYVSGRKAQFISGLIMPLMQLINNAGYVLVCVAGGFMALRRTLEVGDIQAFIQYLRQFTMPIVQTATIANVIQSTMAAAERVFVLLDEAEETDEGAAVPAPGGRGAVSFEAVRFSYSKDKPLIEGLDLEVAPGSLVAIVGPTGAGKTTLVNLLMRFYELDGGRIRVDGQDLRDLKRGAHRARFGMVLQDAWLFSGSIRDNIAYGRTGADFEQVTAAAKAAQADHFIRTLPDGYGTVLNEEASNLSQGQKQLITIARAILADPEVLILDEATSSVDTRTERHIQKALGVLMEGRTSFVIAHRLSTIRDASTILVLESGRIVESGTHDALLSSGGAYARLYESQFAGKAV